MSILVKTAEQIEGIRKSSRLAAATLRHIEQFIVPGITTDEINKHADEFIRENNATPAPLNYKGYPKETCISVNEVVCHGIPDSYKLKEGDILNVDVTTILDGYYGDASTMYAVGDISDKARKLIEDTKKCLDIGVKQVSPGNYFNNIGYQITKYAILQRYGIIYQFCGHGTGLFFHEDPAIQHYILQENIGPKMKPGMIFTIEPMLCLGSSKIIIDQEDKWTTRTEDGMLSAQFEHTVLVTNEGCEILTV